MSEARKIEQARVAVEGILTILRVARVVCVDDTYSEEPSVEDIIVAACGMDKKTLQEALPEIGQIVPDDLDVLKEKVRHIWLGLDSTEQSKRSEHILRANRLRTDEEVEVDDPGAASILSGLVKKELLLTFSPQGWEEEHERLLEENAEQRTLFLFDQDLSAGGGDVDGGIKIISSILDEDNSGNLICGLLTHTVTPENQAQRWAELSETFHIPRDRFLIIPKQYLSKDPILFAQMLKLVALSPDFDELKKKTKEIIEESASIAADRVDEISIYDLDHMVFKISDDEGLWEPDMLFRLHALFHRIESRRRAHQGGELEKLAGRLRSVSHIPTDTKHKLASSTWGIQHTELYEPAEHLNANYLPLELGDIFIKVDSSSKKRYVLLAQPCDLMVRRDGKRYPESTHLPLVEIVPASTKPAYSEEMAYFGESADEQWYVKLKLAFQVKTQILDLCIFNTDGSARLLIGNEVPEAIRPAWKERYKMVAESISHTLKKLDPLYPAEGEAQDLRKMKAKLRSELISHLLDEGLFKGKLIEDNDNRAISFNCRRVGRLCRARASGLLMAYCGCLSRPAYDRTLG